MPDDAAEDPLRQRLSLAGGNGRGADDQIYPDVAVTEVLYNDTGAVIGVAMGDIKGPNQNIKQVPLRAGRASSFQYGGSGGSSILALAML